MDEAHSARRELEKIMTVTERGGYEAGLANKSDPNPFIPGKYHTEWQKGFDAGTAERLSWDAK